MLSEQQVETSVPTEKPSVDAITTVAIASIAIVLVQILHEGMHAATCIVVGAELQEMSALHVSCQSAEPWQSKLVSASASLANLIVGFLAFLRLRRARAWSPESTLFVWLFMLMNWLLAGGYWMFSGIANLGDWANVIDGWNPHWVWRLVMAVAGTALYMTFVWTSLRMLGMIIGGDDDDEQIRRAVRLGVYAYVAVIFAILLAGVCNSYGITGLPSVAALLLALGGMSPFLWMMQWFRSPSFVKSSGEPLIIRRRWSWIAAGVVAVVLYGVVLGPTIHVGV